MTPDEAQQEHQPVTRNGGSRPVPDPTFLTDAAIAKAVESLRDYIDGKYDVLAERMSGHWRLDDERWSAFERSSAALATAAKDSAAARDLATEKAIDKSEKATAETIKTNLALNSTKTDALTKALDEVKLAVSRIDSTKVGGQENRTATYATVGLGITIVLFIIAIVGFLATRTGAT